MRSRPEDLLSLLIALGLSNLPKVLAGDAFWMFEDFTGNTGLGAAFVTSHGGGFGVGGREDLTGTAAWVAAPVEVAGLGHAVCLYVFLVSGDM